MKGFARRVTLAKEGGRINTRQISKTGMRVKSSLTKKKRWAGKIVRKFLNNLLIEEDSPSLPSPSLRSIPTREEKRRGCAHILSYWDAAVEEDKNRTEEAFFSLTRRPMAHGIPVFVIKEVFYDHERTIASFFSKEEAETLLLQIQKAEKPAFWNYDYFIEKLMVE